MKPTGEEGVSSEGNLPPSQRGRMRRLARRLDKHHFPGDRSRPMIRGGRVRYEVAGCTVATAYGGLRLIQQLVGDLGLAEAIDRRLQLFKMHLAYYESDHVYRYFLYLTND